jgi:hypothetical protein
MRMTALIKLLQVKNGVQYLFRLFASKKDNFPDGTRRNGPQSIQIFGNDYPTKGKGKDEAQSIQIYLVSEINILPTVQGGIEPNIYSGF